MERTISTLNLPKTKLTKLHRLGVFYMDELTEDVINSLSLDKPEVPHCLSALSLLETELNGGAILSLNVELDRILKDEITPGKIVEFVGASGAGKTQNCIQLSITAQLPKRLGGVEGQVVYITTNKNFFPNRLRELARKFLYQIGKATDITEDSLLRNVWVFKSNDVVDLCATVQHLGDFLLEKNVKLVIIDNISYLLKDLDVPQRTSFASKVLQEVRSLATTFNFAIVLTNDLTTKIKENVICSTPALGDTFFDIINTRIHLSKNSANVYYAELLKSPTKPCSIKTNYRMF